MQDKISTTSKRLKLLMDERHWKQADIIRLCKPYCDKYGIKLSSAGLSQYVNDIYVPDQDKLLVLGLGLNVSEAWLMGYDVPRERRKEKKTEVSRDQISAWIETASKEDLTDFINIAVKKLAD